ncbi:MAG TPA: gliding motility-associated C-terminal domain-containing protein [Puia sp.]
MDLNSCAETDSVDIHIRPLPSFSAIPDEEVCAGFSIRLKSLNGPGFVYAWLPATGLNDATAPAPDAGPGSTTNYSLHISDSVCPAYSTDLTTTVTVKPSPVIEVAGDNDIDCSIHSAQLRASGALTYSWMPATGLDDAGSPSPIATIDSTTTYVVKGTGRNQCYAYDSVTVKVTAAGANTFVVPNAFTPNGDGHNDCFGVRRWGNVQLQEMAIYDRWGVRVFSTRNPSDCWDGTFRGKPQGAGAFVYTIRAMTFCGVVTRTGVVMLIR